MRKIFKIIRKALIIFIGVLILFLLGLFIWNKIQIKKEIKRYPVIGEMVEVNNHKIHVYTEGSGDETLVFMSGSGTSSPFYDFKPLWSQLVKDYRIVVIEKAGYGWSDVSNVSRDIDYILEETRLALSISNIEGPFVLVPHSMSGLEAIRWAQKYPLEVKAIIGLDPAIPASYDEIKVPSQANLKIIKFVADIGILRLIPSIIENSDAGKSGLLSDEDINAFRSILYRRTTTTDMINEAKLVFENAQKVRESGIPKSTPMYFFISNGKEVGVSNWKEILSSYVNELENGKYAYLDCGHYVHNIETEYIKNEIINYLNDLDNNN
ncbi:alpha/beta hydrolase [Mycoplasmatota bacterium]|nr:alpha/beta hydrolase [Mycoplasmatota bacterium]